MARHNELGRDAELAVHTFLTKKGYSIIENNWRSGHYELDVIALYDNMLVVVEVKSRESDEYGDPEDAVDMRKIRRIVNATQYYIEMKGFDMDVRFDIMSLIVNPDAEGGYNIEHIEDAFLSPLF